MIKEMAEQKIIYLNPIFLRGGEEPAPLPLFGPQAVVVYRTPTVPSLKQPKQQTTTQLSPEEWARQLELEMSPSPFERPPPGLSDEARKAWLMQQISRKAAFLSRR